MENDDGIRGNFKSKYGSNCYELVTGSNRQWNLAEIYCILHGGHLLSVSNRAEEEYIYQLLTWRNVTEPVWTGLNDNKYEEIFHWSSGKILNNFGFTFSDNYSIVVYLKELTLNSGNKLQHISFNFIFYFFNPKTNAD